MRVCRTAQLLAILTGISARNLASADDSSRPLERIEKPGLLNVYRVSPQFISGSSPEGEAGFLSLRELGVRSIISVDGARPNVELP